MFFKKSLIPNYLTIFRLLLVPIIICFMWLDSKDYGYQVYSWTYNYGNVDYTYEFNSFWFFAGCLFLLASFTDFLDGYLARKYKWVSKWGKIWDPLADKILVNAVLITLACQHYILFFIPIVIVIRDIIVDGYRINNKKKEISANIWGKLKTITLMVGIIVVFFGFNSWTPHGWTDGTTYFMYYFTQNILLYIATFLSLLSGGIYIYKYSR
jgi:CDP-diacylglycerol--glycerol-3-phosphate 3-phosphatidyltransferase